MLQVVLERDCFDELLDSRGDLALVSPCIEALKVWCNAREVVGNGFETGVVFFEDAGRKRAWRVRTLWNNQSKSARGFFRVK